MVRRGDIYFIDLDPVQGREQKGRRPCLVVSSDSINRLPLVVTVIPGTDSTNIEKDYPTNLRVSAAETGLRRDTLFIGFQVRSLDRDRFASGQSAGRLPENRMQELAACLRWVFDLT